MALDQNQAHGCASRIKLFPPLIIGAILGCLQSLHTFPVFLNCLHTAPRCGSRWQLLLVLQVLRPTFIYVFCYLVTLPHFQLPLSKSALPFSAMKEVGGRKGWVVPSFHSLLFIRHLVFTLCRPSSEYFTNINSWVPGEVGMIVPILQIRNQPWKMKCIQPGPGSVPLTTAFSPKCLPQIVWPHFPLSEHSSIGLRTVVSVRMACALCLLHSAGCTLRPQ